MQPGGALRIVAAAALCAATLGVAPSPEPIPSPDPDAIFANVRKAWGGGAYPRYAEYATVVEFHKNGHAVRRTWDTTEDLRAGEVFARAFSREEVANPKLPHGTNIALPLIGVINKEPVPDPIGPVAFAIDRDDGLAPAPRAYALARSDEQLLRDGRALTVIGRTGTAARDYDVRLVETLRDTRGTEYHLALTPLRDPAKFRLRELFVDATTWLPEEAVVEGIGNRPPLTKVRWRVEYVQVQGATYIAHETALADLDYGKDGSLRWVNVWFRELALGSAPKRFGFGFGSAGGGDPQHEP